MNQPTESAKQCLACGRDDRQTPLIELAYLGKQLWICPQHLPILIHDPHQLIGALPGAEKLTPAEGHD